MADTGIFATTVQVQRKVGADASSVANVEAYINDFMSQVESQINVETRYNWSDTYATLNVDVKGILTQAASNLAAMYVINYDATSFLQLSFAISRMNVLRDRYDECIKILKEEANRNFAQDQ